MWYEFLDINRYPHWGWGEVGEMHPPDAHLINHNKEVGVPMILIPKIWLKGSNY